MAHRDDVDDRPGPTPVVAAGGRSLRLPLRYHDGEQFTTLHTASHDAVAAELPSDLVRPARWYDGRAIVGVSSFRYRAVTFGTPDGGTGVPAPYGEIGVTVAVTPGPALRVLPVVRRPTRAFVLHLPVTSREARDLGRSLWGLPKFVADMDFAEGPDRREVTLAEAGETVLIHRVHPGGPVLRYRGSAVMYSARDGVLLETVVPMSGWRQVRFGGRGGGLRLGDHPVAEGLRRLGISPAPVAALNVLGHRGLLPAGRPVGAAREYAGHRGTDREFGRYTLRHPGTPPLDLYAQPRAVPT